MLSLLVTLLVVLCVGGVMYWIVQMLPLPAPIKQVALVVVAIILLVWLLQVVGLFGHPWRVPIR